MPRRTFAAMLVATICVLAVLGGCTSGTGVTTETLDFPTPIVSSSIAAPTSGAPVSASRSSAVASPSSTAGTDGLPAGEAAVREAVEAQWVKSWDVLLGIGATPAADREALAATVAIDPTKSKMLEAGTQFDSQGLRTYGALGHRISWPQPINGKSTALIDDCQDASQTGSLETATGNKVTVGVPRDHYQGNLVKGDDGVWRVAEVYYLKDEPC